MCLGNVLTRNNVREERFTLDYSFRGILAHHNRKGQECAVAITEEDCVHGKAIQKAEKAH